MGSLWGTTVGFNTHDLAMVQLYWEQGSFKDGAILRLGKSDPSLIYDGGRYVSQNYAFLSPGFSDTPAMPLPDPGLGAAVGIYPLEHIYILGGFHDANGQKLRSGLDSIENGEFFAAFEFGITPFHGKPGAGRYHATIWYSDDREKAGVSRGMALH